MRHLAASVGVVALVLGAAACSDDDRRAGTPDVRPASTEPSGDTDDQPEPLATEPPAPTIVPPDDCAALLEHYQTEALKDVGPYGLGDRYWALPVEEEPVEMDDGSDVGPLSDTPTDVSSTNVQVEGVDEGDWVKSDGQFIYVLGNGALRVVEPIADGVAERGRVGFDDQSWPDAMFLDGDTIVVIGQRQQAPSGSMDAAEDEGGFWPIGGSRLSELSEIDVSDPDQPRVVRSLIIDGTPVASRLSNGVIRLVIESGPVGIEWAQPAGSGLRAELESTEANRELIRNSTLANWLPYAVLDEGRELRERDILACEDVLIPSTPAGYNTLTVMQVPIGDPLGDWNTGAVVATGAEVYAPADELYIATIDWDTWDVDDGAQQGTTTIHRFTTPAGGSPRYVASGRVDGRLLNQFSMDAFDGHLRVATTSGSPWGAGEESQSQVVVLAEDGAKLVETGRVDELGVTEQIYAVRFMGTVAYVVTFRETDPLYVVDLSDPANPELRGELKIPGFSNYLHPAGEGHLIGVGQHADEDSGRWEGFQISLFDVTDPLDPRRVDTYRIDDEVDGDASSYSPVQYDHRALTEHSGHAYVPFESWRWDLLEETDTNLAGIVVVPLDAADLSGARTIVTGRQVWGPDFDSIDTTEPFIGAERSVGMNDRLYGIGYNGIVVIDLTNDHIIDRHTWRR